MKKFEAVNTRLKSKNKIETLSTRDLLCRKLALSVGNLQLPVPLTFFTYNVAVSCPGGQLSNALKSFKIYRTPSASCVKRLGAAVMANGV